MTPTEQMQAEARLTGREMAVAIVCAAVSLGGVVAIFLSVWLAG